MKSSSLKVLCPLLSYCPTVLLLRPNQTLHIGKGRSHAFRKLSLDPLPKDDCHRKLREKLVRELKLADPNIKVAPLCYSIAYDWYVAGLNKRWGS